MKLTELPVFFLDLQTTGAKPPQSHILEIAWSNLEADDVESHLVALPEGNTLPRFIKEMTGISESDLETARSLSEVLEDFQIFLKQRTPEGPAIIHFAQFEKPFLEAAFQLSGLSTPFETLCTNIIAKKLFPNLPTRGIKGLAGYYGYAKDELKRSTSHVEATKVIWTGLLQDLESRGIISYGDLLLWLKDGPKAKRTKYEYPLPKEKRLNLPLKPGIYKMLSKTSEVLYVGKATSLKDRVNSYFRGQKGRDPKKLEMLTQVWDLEIIECDTPLEAALLETDEIKRLNPRYNISLKSEGRNLIFYSSDFSTMSVNQDEEHPVGPFTNPWLMDSVIKISQSLKENPGPLNLNPLTFFEPVETEILNSGFLIFCQRHSFNPQTFSSIRNILAVGLSWWKKEIKNTEQNTKDLAATASASEEYLSDDDSSDESEPTEATPEDYADKFERHFIRAARSYWRARMMTQLLNSKVEIKNPDGDIPRILEFSNGYFLSHFCNQMVDPKLEKHSKQDLLWRGHGIETYDRMRILFSEIQRMGRHQRRIIKKSEDLSK